MQGLDGWGASLPWCACRACPAQAGLEVLLLPAAPLLLPLLAAPLLAALLLRSVQRRPLLLLLVPQRGAPLPWRWQLP